MAEAAGFAIGAVALISLFTDCVDILKLISASRSLGRDCELVNTRLDIEKALLLQWATRVRLLDPDYDQRLDDPRIRETVSKTLDSIRLLLQESHDLGRRYGLNKETPDPEAKYRPKELISSSRMAQFIREYDTVQARVRGGSSSMARVRWVVVDKEKFGCLLTDLSYFIARLHDMLPPDPKAMISMAREDIRGLSLPQLELACLATRAEMKDIADHGPSTGVIHSAYRHNSSPFTSSYTPSIGIVSTYNHNSLISGSHGNATAIHSQFRRAICERIVLQQIWFRVMDERRDSVTQAHFRTLEWVFTQSPTDLKWDNLPEWLQSGNGIYWMAGKAGSGKSTLMKYMWKDSRTRKLLAKWTGEDTELVIGSFFLWNLGRLSDYVGTCGGQMWWRF
jgi:hypothetical protein